MEGLNEEIETLESIFTDSEIKIEKKGNDESVTVVYQYNPTTKLTLEIKVSSYPSSVPTFILPKHLESLGLSAHLVTIATPLLGSPMLYAIIDGAKDWLDRHSLSLDTPMMGGACKESDTPTNVCKFYVQGKCRFGDQCKNLHPGAKTQTHTKSDTKTESETHTKTESSKSETRTTKSKTKGKNKTDTQTETDSHTKTKSKTDTQTTPKKSPNKKQTEEDEDDEVSKKEKMRTATEVISRILWDPDLPSEQFTVGYLDRFIGIQEKPFKDFSWEDISTVGNNVLAVPKHRIQYFKYNDIIVWDKRSQTDNFFGSRGGLTIQEIIAKNQKESTKEKEEEREEGELSLMEVETTTDDKPHYRTDVNRPTHFICLHVNNEEVIQEVQKVVSHITNLNPQLGECLIKVPSLHVTLCMARLTNDEQIERAKQVLQSVKLQFISLLPNCIKLSFTGVDNFRERLIYIKIKPEPALSKFVSHLIEQLQGAGLKTPGNHEEYTPHITIVKLSRPMQRELKTDIINPACYKPFLNTPLGQQPITSIHLCAMHAPAQEDGFYLRYDTLTNSLLGLPHSFITLVENQLGLLADLEYLNESDRDQLQSDLTNSVQTQDEDKFEEIIEELIRLNKEASTFESLISSQPTVVILRGLPGSGKSYLAKNCQEILQNPSRTTVISADDYFTEGTEYRFNPATAYKAHQYCLQQFLHSLSNGCKLVIIDNTNTQLWEYRIYTHICDILGFPYHILEIPILTPVIIEMARSRNIHNIQPAAITKMCQRWEEDERRVLVPPQIAYPRTWPSKEPQIYSITSLCNSIPERNFDVPLVPVYTGIFLNIESQWELLKTYRPTHSELFASHVTLAFKPNSRQLKELAIGKNVKIQVIGESDNGRVQAAIVELPSHVTSENKSPHITISTIPGISPKLANAMLQSKLIKLNQTIYLDGVIGLVVRDPTQEEMEGKEPVEGSTIDKTTFTTVTSQNDLKSLLPKLIMTNSQEEEEDLATPTPCTGILTGTEHKITQLFIFDFDGTLFIPPGNYQGRRDYEKLTGKKWHRKGWLGHADSLLPPLKVQPGPALSDFRCHANRAGSYTVVLTGRVDRVRPGLSYIFEKAQIFPERLICKPDVTEETTSSYKQRKVKELLAEFPDVTHMKFWDDIPENLFAIRYLSQNIKDVQFDIIDATKMSDIHTNMKSPKKPLPNHVTRFGSHLQAHLVLNGLLPSLEHTTAIQEGLEFISTQFAELINFTGNPLNLVYTFGSSPLNRISDVDLCLLAPPTQSHIEWITVLAKKLDSCGITHTHIGHSSRCPRLTVLLQYSQTPSIEFDIIIGLIPNEEFFKNPIEHKLPAVKIAEMRQGGDNVTKVALTGPLFMERIENVSKSCNIPIQTIGALVEFTLQLLMAKREKGNAYHCIRTFHIIKLLIDDLESRPVIIETSCDQLFVSFVHYLSLMTFEDWRSTCNDFVPEEYFPRLITLFNETNSLLKQFEHITIECYEDMLMRSVFPPEGYTPVEIRLSGNDNVKKWKAKIVIEARLPTYIRQLITRGLNVVSNGNINNNRFCFAVPSLKSSKDTLQQVLRPFWTEMADLKKEDGLNINLTFGLPTDFTTTTVPLPTSDGKTAAIMESITSFVSSEETQFHLPSSLSAHTRLLVHEAAESLGLVHSSVGKGNNRHIVLKKL